MIFYLINSQENFFFSFFFLIHLYLQYPKKTFLISIKIFLTLLAPTQLTLNRYFFFLISNEILLSDVENAKHFSYRYYGSYKNFYKNISEIFLLLFRKKCNNCIAKVNYFYQWIDKSFKICILIWKIKIRNIFTN